ncbi:PcfJ domain-containing protein [Bradyrhizobium sp. UFLA05-109]
MQTGRALRVEGAAMHHCVASYWRNVVNGKSHIYSIRENDRDARARWSANTIQRA